MGNDDPPAWVSAATPAAVRLAAEAGSEVDGILHDLAVGAAAADRLARHATRLERCADLLEVATDLAGLLWAECDDVPLIATILDEPAARASLEAVAEARRCAGRRLAERAAAYPHPARPPEAGPAQPRPDLRRGPVVLAGERSPTRGPATGGATSLDTGPAVADAVPPDPPAATPAADPADPAVTAPAGPPAGGRSASRTATRTAPTSLALTAGGVRPSVTGAMVAGAAATAVLLFGRRLRRT